MTVITSHPFSSREHYSVSEVVDSPTNFSTCYWNLSHKVPSYQPCTISLRIPTVHPLTLYDNRNVRPGGAAWIPNELVFLWTLYFPLVTGFLRNLQNSTDFWVTSLWRRYREGWQIVILTFKCWKQVLHPHLGWYTNMFGVMCARAVHTLYCVLGMSTHFIVC